MSDQDEADTTLIAIDKVRASKAGHAYHEAWAARSALELLLPANDLVAIALEGFDEADERDLGAGAVEIADLVRYHGARTIARASHVAIVQFKYSIAGADRPVRAADLAKTLTKFVVTDAELRTKHGDDHVDRVVRYEFATNRPIHSDLLAAVMAIVSGTDAIGDIARQAGQLVRALEAYPHPHADLLRRLDLVGSQGSLVDAERGISATLAAWSEASDPDAEKRLLKLRNLIRIKAGPGSDADKTIDRVAVLAELDVEHEDRLYPTPDAFPDVVHVIPRAVFDEVAALAKAPGDPLVVHAAGGMGKTVLMQGLADRLAAKGPVVLFDGFGAGQWRNPSDGRHLPERTLVHLANLLAGRGLCDILLPIADVTGLLKAFRRRLAQAVASARQTQEGALVSLVLDAVDHAGLASRETGAPSFAHLLLRSIGVAPIEGVRVVASCRTERLSIAMGDASCRTFAIPLFSDDEARDLIRRRVPDAAAAEVSALIGRSGRNPRCLDNLIAAGRPFDPLVLPDTPSEAAALLDKLLRERLAKARAEARSRGASDADIDLLLTGIALLVPPVPIDELAAAYGLEAAQVQSFAADLAPLLERTAHGLMFRDEPTETLIRSTYGGAVADRSRIIAGLQARQSSSNYAARALPALLTSLRDADQLITLAFDSRVPHRSSQVSARDIRLARISAAISLCAELGRRNDLLRLLLEASLVAAGHERSDRFLYEYPDLAAIAGDAEAQRRLAVTQVGWPGGKHAAQAIASSFVGDGDEARRHARRSIDWHNWASKIKSSDRFNDRTVSRDRDDIGFTYVEMLAGNDIRVARYLAQRGGNTAFRKFDTLFDLFERHQRSPHPPAENLARRLRRCRVPSRALFAAALRYFGDDPAVARRLIAALGCADNAQEDERGPLAMAVGLAIARAVDLGLDEDAAAIVGGAAHSSESIHNYSSSYPIERTIDATVLAAGMRAALNRKPAKLLDIAPAELLALVPPSVKARGPDAFARTLEQKLAPPEPRGGSPGRKRRDGLDESRRSDYARTLSERISPLLVFAQAAADVVRSPPGQTRTDVVAAAFDTLIATVERSSTYPYRDGKAYVARIGFRVIFYLADALGALDASLARRMAVWVATAPGMLTADLVDIVARLARASAHHDAALLLAAQIDRNIQLDTDVGTRVSAYGDLARAVWRVSIDEAAVYFRRALDLAEAIGSDDFDRTNHLLELAGHYAGPELSPQAAHCLARIFELNQGEDGRFPWIEYARAMVPIAGRAMLATLGRLDDRETTRLGLSLGPALSELVKAEKVSPDAAAALCGLSAPFESWTWHFSDLAAAIAERLAPERLEWFFQLLLVEIDRVDQLSPTLETIEGLHRLAGEHMPIASPSRLRIAALLERRRPAAVLPAPPPMPATDSPAPFPVDLTDPDQIDREILGQTVDHAGRRWPVSTLRTLALQPATPAARLDFVRAVVESSAATLVDKLRALDDHLEIWAVASPAMRDALPALGLRLAAKHALELASSNSDAWAGWRDLVTYFGSDLAQLVEQVIAALRANADNLGGNAWLALAAKLARAASPTAIAEGLERFLSLTDAKLPAEVGDGPWTPAFAVTGDETALVAGLIWSRLGHSIAAMRWRAAHAVRRFAALGRFEVLDHLVALAETENALPFVDAKLPFFVLHARLWLLIALARITKDGAAPLVRHQDYLERVAFSTDFPHVIMREFALMGLRAIAPLLAPAERDALAARLATANRSPWPHAPRADYTDFRYMPRPDASPRSDNAFSLDYDFSKYPVESLCRVFACPGWQVEDRISAVVRGWDATVGGMYDGARSDSIDRSWSSGYMPGRDQYGGYLGWHALMLVAGDLLATQPVVGEHWDGDAWAAFLGDYLVSRDDGLWLADLTDMFPLDLPKPDSLSMPDSGKNASGKDRELLAPLLGLAGDTLAGDWLPVSARWSIDRETTLTVNSVIANPGDARSTVMTLLSDEPFFRWLPDDEDEIKRQFGRGHSVQAWVSETPNPERELDRYDPYASSTALDRPFPAEWVRAEQSIAADDVLVRSWSRDGVPAYRAEAWGAEGGGGEYAWSETGYRLSIRRDALFERLALSGKCLVLALKLQKYCKGKSIGRLGDTSSFTHRSLILAVNERGAVWLPQRLSKQANAALAALNPDSRRDFYYRFRAIAGLPDERAAQRASRTPIDIDAYRIMIEGTDLDL